MTLHHAWHALPPTFLDTRRQNCVLDALMVQTPVKQVIDVPAGHIIAARPQVAIASVSHEEVLAAVQRAVPRGLPPDTRQDVMSAMVLAVFEGDLEPAAIAGRAREYLAAYRRQADEFRFISTERQFGSDGWTLGQSLGL